MSLIESEVVSLEIEGGVGRIRVERESALNALNYEVLNGLGAACAKLNEIIIKDGYGKVRVVTLRGAGEKAFVAGADIKLMHGASREDVGKFIILGQQVMRGFEELPLPVIAVVDGFAIGGGLELALACDLIICTERSKLGQAEVNLGIIPGFGGTQRLARRVGIGRAKRLIYTAENISGEEAYRIGLADWYVPHAVLDQTLSTVTKTISSKGPLAIKASKSAIQQGYEPHTDKGLHFEVEQFLDAFSSKDANEGLSAFVEKRPAQFKGE